MLDINFKTMYVRNYRLHGRWGGTFAEQKIKESKTINYFIEPFFMFDFSQSYHLKKHQSIKIYFGFKINYYNFLQSKGYLKYQNKSYQEKIAFQNQEIFNNLPNWSLKEKIIYDDLQQFKFQLMINVNQKFTNHCAQFIKETINERFFIIKRSKLYNFDASIPFYNLIKPLYIPIKCLRKNLANDLKILFSVGENDQLFDSRFNAITFSFFWNEIQKLKIYLDDQTHKIIIPYWFLVTSKRGKLLEIKKINHLEWNITSKVASHYLDSLPIEKLWKIIFYKIHITNENLLTLNKLFAWKIISKNLENLQQNQQIFLQTPVKTNTNYLNFNQQWKSSFEEEIHLQQMFSLLEATDFSETKIFDKINNFKIFKIIWQHFFIDKSVYDPEIKKIIITPKSDFTLLSDWKHYKYRLQIKTFLNWETFLNEINLEIIQETFIDNQKYHHLQITPFEETINTLLEEEKNYQWSQQILLDIFRGKKNIHQIYLQKKHHIKR